MKRCTLRNRMCTVFMAAMIGMTSVSIPIYAEDIAVETPVDTTTTEVVAAETTEVTQATSSENVEGNEFEGPSMMDEETTVVETAKEPDSVASPVQAQASIPAQNVVLDQSQQQIMQGSGLDVAEQPVGLEATPNVSSTAQELALKRWRIGDGQPRSITCRVTVPANTTRYEIFYNKDSIAPEITFTTQSGFTYKTSQDVYTDPATGTRYETRRANQVSDYSNMMYMIVYISQPADPGIWNITIDLDEKTDTFLMVKTEIPEDYNLLVKEYKMYVIDTIVWAIDSKRTDCRLSDIVSMAAAEKRPVENDVPDTIPDAKKKTDPLVYVVIILIGLIILFSVFIVLNIINSKKAKQELSDKKVKNANKRFKKKKSKENGELDSIMDKYNDEYVDEEINEENYSGDDYSDNAYSDKDYIKQELGEFNDKEFENTNQIQEETEDLEHNLTSVNVNEDNPNINPPQFDAVSENPAISEISENNKDIIKEPKNELKYQESEFSHIEKNKNNVFGKELKEKSKSNTENTIPKSLEWATQEEKKAPSWMESAEEDDEDGFF